MMKIDLNKKFKDLHGNDVQLQDTMAETLANMLAIHTENPAKCMTWATDLIKTGELSVDAIDLEWIKTLVIDYRLSNIVKIQLIDAFEAIPVLLGTEE